jgi:hypothetical protein
MKKIYITNENREGQRIWFNKVDDRTYTIDSDSDYALEYACMNYTSVPSDAMIYDFEMNGKKGIYTSFDPSGGPYIGVGQYKIEGKTVVRIYDNNGTLTFNTEM